MNFLQWTIKPMFLLTVPVVKNSTTPTVTVVAPVNQTKTETNVHPGSKDQNIGVIAAITAGIVAIILIVGFVVSCHVVYY